MSDSEESFERLAVRVETHLKEFDALRREIETRGNLQSVLIGFTLAAVGTVLGFAVTTEGLEKDLLSLLLFIGPILGILFLDHGAQIHAIGDYIRQDLRSSVVALTDAGGLGWEEWARIRRRNPLLTISYRLPVLLVFAAGPVLGLAGAASDSCRSSCLMDDLGLGGDILFWAALGLNIVFMLWGVAWAFAPVAQWASSRDSS